MNYFFRVAELKDGSEPDWQFMPESEAVGVSTVANPSLPKALASSALA